MIKKCFRAINPSCSIFGRRGVDEIAAENPDKKVGKVNVDEEPELASKFDVMSIPTLLVFEDGELVNRAVGARPKEMILDLFEE